MRDDQKTKGELLQELNTLRRRVSKLEQAEEAPEHSEKQFKELFENTAVGVYRTTPDGRIIMANPALVRMLGYSSFEEFSQRDLKKEGFAPQYPRSIFKDLIEREGKVVGLESAWLKRDGTTLFITESARVIRDGSGKTLYYEGIVQDITDRKEAEDKIKRAAEDWSKTFDATSDLVFVQDADFKFVKVNRSVCDVLKVKPEDLIGKKCYEVLHKSDKPWPNCPLVKALKDRRPHIEEVYDPNIGIPLLISTSLLFDENGELTGAVHIAKDITERKRVEEQLREYQQRLRSMASELSVTEERERRHIATGLHDGIVQPLVFAKMKLDELWPSTTSVDSGKRLEEVSNMLDQIIEDTQTLTYDLGSPTLYELGLEAAVKEWLTEEIEQKHSISTFFEADGVPKLMSENISGFLFRAVRELLVNVVKHAQAQSIKVSLRGEGDKIRICVDDDGVGFELSETSVPKDKKSGYGLFSIKEHLTHIGGCIDIKSEPDHGTQVVLVAPVKENDVTT